MAGGNAEVSAFSETPVASEADGRDGGNSAERSGDCAEYGFVLSIIVTGEVTSCSRRNAQTRHTPSTTADTGFE